MSENNSMLTNYAEAFAFIGNSLLAPMSQTSDVGLTSAFWDTFPTFGDDGVGHAVCACKQYACEAADCLAAGDNPVQRVSVEYTQLFVGPPKPAAAPWETFYRNDGATVGFGEATFEMRQLLRDAGLEVSNDNNQYADHIGIELLYLSVLCERAATGDKTAFAQACDFAETRVLSWIGDLKEAVAKVSPKGYILRIISLAVALLQSFANSQQNGL